MNSLVLAYLGDSIYEVYIREYLINQGICKVSQLQKEAVLYVSAKGQCKLITKMLENNILTNDEIDIFLRARNHKSNHHPKNTDIITYKYATGFEAVIGYLYLNNKERLNEIIEFCLKEVD